MTAFTWNCWSHRRCIDLFNYRLLNYSFLLSEYLMTQFLTTPSKFTIPLPNKAFLDDVCPFKYAVVNTANICCKPTCMCLFTVHLNNHRTCRKLEKLTQTVYCGVNFSVMLCSKGLLYMSVWCGAWKWQMEKKVGGAGPLTWCAAGPQWRHICWSDSTLRFAHGLSWVWGSGS